MRQRLFISPIVTTRKKITSIKLVLDSKLLNDQFFKNKYQMPNIHELIENVALQILEKSNGRVWFTNFFKPKSAFFGLFFKKLLAAQIIWSK